MLLSSVGGYILAILGKLFGTLSYLFMKVANHQVEEKKKKSADGEEKNVSEYCTSTWWFGIGFVVIGSILNVIALPFCDMVLFSTTVGISIVFNNAVAWCWLKEKMIWKYDAPSFILVVGGSTAIVLLSRGDEMEDFTPDEIWRLLGSVGTICFVAFIIVIMVIALISLKVLIS